MNHLIFTLDYEIYGDGRGSLMEHVYEPCESLIDLFCRRNRRFVAYIEAAELEKFREVGLDDRGISAVEHQVRRMYQMGFEIGLHIHPQWYNAAHDGQQWHLDYAEYNLCALPRARITEMVTRSIAYLRRVLNDPDYTPLSFRAGNWLFQPTDAAAEVLASAGVRVDSSVFKGGRQGEHGLDYRRATRLGEYWRFSSDVTVADDAGPLLEVPIHTRMVPFWKMVTARRVGASAKGGSGGHRRGRRSYWDYCRLRYPKKLDFCRMSLNEMKASTEHALLEPRTQSGPKPIVAIGHTKDHMDVGAIDAFLSFLDRRHIGVSLFRDFVEALDAATETRQRADTEANWKYE